MKKESKNLKSITEKKSNEQSQDNLRHMYLLELYDDLYKQTEKITKDILFSFKVKASKKRAIRRS